MGANGFSSKYHYKVESVLDPHVLSNSEFMRVTMAAACRHERNRQ